MLGQKNEGNTVNKQLVVSTITSEASHQGGDRSQSATLSAVFRKAVLRGLLHSSRSVGSGVVSTRLNT